MARVPWKRTLHGDARHAGLALRVASLHIQGQDGMMTRTAALAACNKISCADKGIHSGPQAGGLLHGHEKEMQGIYLTPITHTNSPNICQAALAHPRVMRTC